MPPTRSKATTSRLPLDEQSFQSLLAAAFTIQQHNDQIRRSRQPDSSPVDLLEPPSQEALESPLYDVYELNDANDLKAETLSQPVCEKCGAPKLFPDSPCAQCPDPSPSEPLPSETLRPGERLQRNWASMWMMSQEQSQWLNSSTDAASIDAGPDTATSSEFAAGSPAAAERRPRTALSKSLKSNGNRNGRKLHDHAVPQSASNALVNPRSGDDNSDAGSHPVAKVTAPADESSAKTDESDLNLNAEPELVPRSDDSTAKWDREPLDSPTLDGSTPEDLAREESQFALQAVGLENEVNAPPRITSSPGSDSQALHPTIWQQLADFRVKLSFHRADLYLTLAVAVAFVALLWPATGPARHGTLSTWQRTLITLGIAEAAPPAVAHFQGDPSVQVWVDPHTGIYYCPGEDQYGKTTGGRYSTQREAQMDSFESSTRSACE